MALWWDLERPQSVRGLLAPAQSFSPIQLGMALRPSPCQPNFRVGVGGLGVRAGCCPPVRAGEEQSPVARRWPALSLSLFQVQINVVVVLAPSCLNFCRVRWAGWSHCPEFSTESSGAGKSRSQVEREEDCCPSEAGAPVGHLSGFGLTFCHWGEGWFPVTDFPC